MVEWEKGQLFERQQWEIKVYELIHKLQKGERVTYSKYKIIAILKNIY